MSITNWGPTLTTKLHRNKPHNLLSTIGKKLGTRDLGSEGGILKINLFVKLDDRDVDQKFEKKRRGGAQ